MKKHYGTFTQSEDGEIIWVNVYYAIDKHWGEPEMYHLSVQHYQSGDITEYMSDDWMKKFEDMAWINYNEENDRLAHFYQMASDYHDGQKVGAGHILKMMQSGYTKDKIIDELAKLTDDIYAKYVKVLEYGVPNITIPIDFATAPDWIKEKFDKK